MDAMGVSGCKVFVRYFVRKKAEDDLSVFTVRKNKSGSAIVLKIRRFDSLEKFR